MSKQAAPRTEKRRPGFSVTVTAWKGKFPYSVPANKAAGFHRTARSKPVKGQTCYGRGAKPLHARRETIRAFGDAASRCLQVENEDGTLYLIYFVRALSILRETAVPA